MQSVDRVVGVLMCFADGDAELGVTDISRRLELPKSAVHRVLEALVANGLVRKQRERGKYQLGPRAVELSLATFGTADIQAMALPVMSNLRDEVGETVTLSLRVNRERVYAAQAESRQVVRMTIEVGARAPLYAGASGRAILMTFTPAELEEYLAEIELTPLTQSTLRDQAALRDVLDEDRARGWTVSLGERDPYAAAVAAPLVSRSGHAFGCLSICGPRDRMGEQAMDQCGPSVARATQQLSEMVAGT